MYIHCTGKLIDKGKLSIEEIGSGDSLFSWYSHIKRVHNKNLIILINVKTGYPIFLYGLKMREIQELDEALKYRIVRSFWIEKYPHEQIQEYIDRSPKQNIHKTESRSLVGTLNEVTATAMHFEEFINLFDEDESMLSELSYRVSKMIFKIDGNYVHPSEEMKRELALLFQRKMNN